MQEVPMPVCPRCGKIVKDLGRHLRRGRCKAKGRRRIDLPIPGTPEENLRDLRYMVG